ncbi:MAG: heavy-metal-associated domain-containing protein [Desulfarculales bacterium]|jgi:copper chaperone CopZ|nr:heavy-metal-associated domain-containing protein [Desulfarculales bacterium]
MSTKTLHIAEISCQHCVNNIKNELLEMPGVISINGDVAARNIIINWEQPASLSDILNILDEIGYPADKD